MASGKRKEHPHTQFGQGSYYGSYDRILTRINTICKKHKCATSICHCMLDSKNVVRIGFYMGTRVPRKTAKNKWKKLLKLVK